MKLIQLVTLAFILSLSTNVFSQEMKVAGTVYDTTGTKPVMNAMVMAVRIKDSLLLDFTRTDINGDFIIDGFEVDTFSLIIEHSIFDEKTYYIFGNSENDEINIPSVVLAPKSQEIAEVVIYAYKDPIYYRGDTLVYVADSFKVAENAVVEDLLKKLPGITVDKDGKIISQGQEISKVLVDGDEFFGDDPTIATKNLGADGIATVEIYEKDNDEGIGGDDEKIQVLDLKLKEEAKKGYFGRMSGATDFALTNRETDYDLNNSFYEGEMLLNKFDGAQKISIFALGSNTPRSNFGWGDMNKFGLENENSGGNRWNGGNTDNTSGIPQTLKAGVYYSDKIGKKKQTKVGFNYSYYNDRLDELSDSRSQYFLTDTTYFTEDKLNNYTENESHRFNIRFESQIDSLTSIEIRPSVKIDAGNTDQADTTTFFGEDGIQSLQTTIGNINDSKGYSINGMARINRKFMKKKREFEARYDIALLDNQTDGSLLTRTGYSTTPILNDTIDQSRINNNSTSSHYATLTYIEPIAKKYKLELEYLFEYGFSTQDKETYDFSNGDYSLLNESLTNVFDNTRLQNRGGVKLIYEGKKHTVRVGGKVRNIKIDNVNMITDSVINQNFTNFLPNFRYSFKPSMSKRFNVTYRTSSSQPSINDLQPIPDISNPNSVKTGNPDLQPNYVHTLNFSFNTWKAMTGQYIYLGGMVNYTDNAFASSTTYSGFTSRSQTVNVDGNTFATVYGGAGIPLFGRKLNIDPSFNGSFNHYTNFIDSAENITNSLALTPSLSIRLVWDSLEIDLKGSYSYNNPESNMNGISQNTRFFIEEYSVDVDWRLPKGFRIGVEGVYTKNSQPNGGFYNTEFFVVNTKLSKSFLKTENLEIALIGNDILNQNVNARREVSGNITTDYRTQIISRYFLLKATLRFNNRKTKENDFKGMH